MGKKGGKGAGSKKKKAGNGRQQPRDGARPVRSVKQPALPTIRQQLASLDPPCTVYEVDADGNCLFRSLHDQLGRVVSVADHTELREQLVDFIEENAAFYGMFVEDDETIDAYIQRMREDGSWGGHIELHSCVRRYGVNAIVYQNNCPTWRIMEWPEDTMMVSVSYHDGNHYNSVRSKGGVPASLLGGRLPAAVASGSEVEGDTEGDKEDEKDEAETGGVDDEKKVDELALKRGQCPCGSGRKYRKCCKKRQKRFVDDDPDANSCPDIDQLAAAVENIDI